MATKLKKQPWERDVVYLVQFPRAACMPSVSPFCLKLETWLRMADIRYENIIGGMSTRSQKGQLPFVELNGVEIADSHFIINQLTEIFHKESMEAHLDADARAVARAFDTLIEGSVFWVKYMDAQSVGMTRFFEDDIMGRSLPSVAKYIKPLIGWRFGSALKTKLYNQGIGRHSTEEAVSIGKEDLRALSTYLGKKEYFTGKAPTRLDATAFGHLATLWYMPFETELKKFVASDCTNLVDWMERVKSTFWPDWEEMGRSLAADTKWKPGEPDEQPPAVVENAAGDT